uniref:Uncharacterized protein LOC111105752 n=1 Tax=Crassostrea virginica TaxID=6565 RepID=A0A8B8AYL1_CRAVI|nr:uncharacterized protein LOC111105752 [Crassostrea virginica]XP_022295840.1 uncharacterized protein LOC111105752 [Crassostrea virginica]
MKNLEISFALFFVIFTAKSAALVEWPFGTYTLVKPNAGCPSGWLEGWRYQDNEDHNNKNKMSYGHHFYGSFGRNLKFYYCTRDSNEFSGRRYWPSGNYCILKQGASCPQGFRLVVFTGMTKIVTTKIAMVAFYQVVSLEETPG